MHLNVPFIFDTAAVIFLGLSFLGVMVKAPVAPLRFTLGGLLFLFVLFGAVLSCAASPPPPKPKPSPCIVTLEAFCTRGAQCRFFTEQACMAQGVDQCTTVKGITAFEADICAEAVSQAPCKDIVPQECMGIADPPSTIEASPQPDTRKL